LPIKKIMLDMSVRVSILDVCENYKENYHIENNLCIIYIFVFNNCVLTIRAQDGPGGPRVWPKNLIAGTGRAKIRPGRISEVAKMKNINISLSILS
jgi:hypothetical protein